RILGLESQSSNPTRYVFLQETGRCKGNRFSPVSKTKAVVILIRQAARNGQPANFGDLRPLQSHLPHVLVFRIRAACVIFSAINIILLSRRRFSFNQYGLVISLNAWIAAWIPSAQATAMSLMSPCTSPTAKIPFRLVSK